MKALALDINLAALIIRKDNPKFVDIVSEFSNTIAMFRVKPKNPTCLE